MFRYGLIPAAGAGLRAYPATRLIPKVLLRIAGQEVLLRNIQLLRDKLQIQKIWIITGYRQEAIYQLVGNGNKFGVQIEYLSCSTPEIGLARGILLAKPFLQEPFVTLLGDEVYEGSNHERILSNIPSDYAAVCGLVPTEDVRSIQKNYSVELEGQRITNLIEKPEHPHSNIMGVGTYVFTPDIFRAIENTAPSRISRRVELTDAIRTLAQEAPVYGFQLEGKYYNINTVEDYHLANFMVRSESFSRNKVSVVIPARNEEATIGHVVQDFRQHVEEVLVIDNDSSDLTAEVAEKSGATVKRVRLEGGYGSTIRYGMQQAKGDILVIVEADHSFRAKDLGKFLEYLKDADMVIGTRTVRHMVEHGAKMRGPLRWGNILYAKLVELLWWRHMPHFTDVGCTYRAIWKEAYREIEPYLEGQGPEFSPEMMVEALNAKKKVVEVPISYFPRLDGISKHSASYLKVFETAARMLRIILKKRFFRKKLESPPVFLPEPVPNPS